MFRRCRILRSRGRGASLLVLCVLACASAVASSGAATGNSVVGANVLSSTSITDLCTAPTARQLGTLTTNTSQVTSSACRFDFSSSNSTASLRISQMDGTGSAMTSSPTWTTQQGSSPTFGSIDVVDANVSFAGQDDGSIWRTPDDGVTWNLETSGTTAAISDIAAIDGTNAYATTQCFFGCASVRKRTTGGGATWANQTMPGGLLRLYGVDYVPSTPNTAVAVGSGGKIIRTTDGGATAWVNIASGTTEDLNDVDLVDATTGYAVGANNTVLRTADAGATWIPVVGPLAGVNITSVSSPVAGTVWVTTQNSLYRSTNADSGAATWTGLAASSSVLTRVKALSTTDVYFMSWGLTGHSTDASNATPTWNTQSMPSTDFGQAMDVDAGTHLKIGAWQGNIFGTSTFVAPFNVEKTVGTSIRGIDTWGRNTAMAVGELGHAWRTTNGSTWTSVPTSNYKHLSAVDLVSATEAWAAGSNGAVFHTTNLGTSWSEIATGAPTNPRFYGILQTRTGALLVVGTSGIIMRSIDNGTTWTQITSGTAGFLKSIDQAPDGDRIWAVGQGGYVITSTDDGRTWTNRSTGASDLHSVTATTGDSAWAVGASSTVVKTTDGGATWTPVGGPPAGTSWYTIDSAGPNVVGLAGGPSAQRTFTTDGGATWTTTTGIFNLEGLAVVDANTAYIGTTGGGISGMAPGGSIADFTNWATAGFGGCLQAVGLSAAVDQWAVANGGACDTGDSTEFHPVPTSPLTIARTGLAGDLGRADLYWGMRVGSSTPPANYIAHVRVEVVAPAL